MTRLEHINLTVGDPDAVAAALCDLLGWRVRWSGEAIGKARSVHVGEVGAVADAGESYDVHGAVNRLGVTIDDLDAVERHVSTPCYPPAQPCRLRTGRRFRFDGLKGIEIEMVSYA